MSGGDPRARGLEAYERQAWGEAFDLLSGADEQGALGAEDLARLATAAYLTGHVDAASLAWERAYRAFVEGGQVAPAVRCAFWLALTLMQRGEHARGGGWLTRAQRVLEESGLDCVEQGYLRIPAALGALNGGEPAAASAQFGEVVAVADRFGDLDLRALGLLGRGQALVSAGDVRGKGLLDEAMLAVTSDEVSSIAAGIVYCGVIVACQQVFDVRRAVEWTAALSRWCATQPDLKPYRGQCLVHRSEIMRMRGEWTDAMEEVQQACEHLAEPPGDPVLGMALYQQAELLRLRGELVRAEETYRRASHAGHPVQPGLALLRLAQGRMDDAAATIRRVVADAEGPVERAPVLAAQVEVALATGDLDSARTAVEELEAIATDFDSPYLQALVGHARGRLLLADGEPAAACAALRASWLTWRELDAPYEAACVRLRLAQAFHDLDDHDTAELELDAARTVFERLHAAPALARAHELAGVGPARPAGGLTAREVEVLRLVATGATNREIADTLVISERTVARHVGNILTKLAVPSRAAATAFAYQHDLA